MQSLQVQASEESGVSQEDAFGIDKTNLYERLGHQCFINLSTNFYTSSTKEEAIQNQYEFFIQRMGGPALYSQRKGHPALIGRHGPYAVTTAAAHRWLHHMELALNETEEIDPGSRKLLMDFFRHTAFFLVAGKQMVNTQRIVGYAGKHTGGA